MKPPFRIAYMIILLSVATPVLAGPPFRTDDPQPVDLHHWEFYVASMQEFARGGSTATAPHIEVNFGALPGVQLHMVAPLGYAHSTDGTSYGYADTELGVKYRFIGETDTTPQAGVFPIVEIPTGDARRQLGSGHAQVFLPAWVQKSWGGLTSYAGGGYWINPGAGNRNWMFAGWEVQYDFSDVVTLGTEVFYHSADSGDSTPGAGFNIGGFINLSEHDHILFSFGRSLVGESVITGYAGFQYTL